MWPTFTLWQVKRFGTPHPQFHVLLMLFQECQAERPHWPGPSSAAIWLTPSDVLFVVLSCKSAWIPGQKPDSTFRPVETRSTSWAVSRILGLCGHQTPLCWSGAEDWNNPFVIYFASKNGRGYCCDFPSNTAHTNRNVPAFLAPIGAKLQTDLVIYTSALHHSARQAFALSDDER